MLGAAAVVVLALTGCSTARPGPSESEVAMAYPSAAATADVQADGPAGPSRGSGVSPGSEQSAPSRPPEPPWSEASDPGAPAGLRPLVAGHNDLEADRINIVVGAHGAPAGTEWQQYAHDLLTWDGPLPVGTDDRPTSDPAAVAGLAWGPFALEPLASHRELVNVWSLDQPVPDMRGFYPAGEPLPVDLPHTVLVTLSWEAQGSAFADTALFIPPELPTGDGPWFGGVTMPVNGPLEEQSLRIEAGVLAHELGHALFHLPDTYVFDESGGDTEGPVRAFYPGCADGPEQARQWWGDLVGTVDPAFDDWLSAHERHGIPVRPEDAEVMADLIRVDYVPNGCFGPEGVAVRSSQGGLMHSNYQVPLLDAAQRRWAEHVLDAWRARVR